MKISLKKIFLTILAIIIMVIGINFIPQRNNFSLIIEWCQSITIFIFVLASYQIITLHIVIPKRQWLYVIFFILIYLYHFSHIILQGINYDFGSNTRNNVFFRFSESTVVDSTILSLKFVWALYVGAMLYFCFKHNREPKKIWCIKKSDNNEKKMKKFSLALLLVGFIFDFYYSINTILATLTGGYGNITEGMSHYLIKIIGYLLLPGVILLITDKSIRKVKKNIVLVLFVFWKLFTMISGLRAYSLISIMMICYIYFRTNMKQKISLKYIVLLLVVIQLGGGIIVGIRETRIEGVNIKVILQYMFDIKSNIILNMMSEFGITQNVICVILEGANGVAAGGAQLLFALLTAVPWISKIMPNVQFDKMNYDELFNMHNYGGSLIGDSLFDFGVHGGLFFCIILGVILAYLFTKYEEAIRFNFQEGIAVFSPIMVDLIFSIRSSLAKMPRMIVWYLIFYMILRFLFNRKTNKSRFKLNRGI